MLCRVPAAAAVVRRPAVELCSTAANTSFPREAGAASANVATADCTTDATHELVAALQLNYLRLQLQTPLSFGKSSSISSSGAPAPPPAPALEAAAEDGCPSQGAENGGLVVSSSRREGAASMNVGKMVRRMDAKEALCTGAAGALAATVETASSTAAGESNAINETKG